VSQTTPEGLPPNISLDEKIQHNLPPSQTVQQNWNPQIQTTPQPQEIALDKKSSNLSRIEQNVVCLDQEFADL